MKPYEFDLNNPEHCRERAIALEHEGDLEIYDSACNWRPRATPGEPLEPDARYRPAPEPEIAPYTLDTFPVDLLRVKMKDTKGIWTIGSVTESHVYIHAVGSFIFQEFLDRFTQCDGSPCGVKKI